MKLIDDHCPIVLCQFLAQGNIHIEAVNQLRFHGVVHEHTGKTKTECTLLLLASNDNACFVLLLSRMSVVPFQYVSEGIGAGVEDDESSFALFFHAESILL